MKPHASRCFRRGFSLASLIVAIGLPQFSVQAAPLPGSLKSFGTTSNGQLGNGQGSNSSFSLPFQIGTGASNVAAGYYHSLFLKSDGTLWAMGYNSAGQLGDG